MLAKCIKSIFLLPVKTQHTLTPVEDSLGLRHSGIYCITCECGVLAKQGDQSMNDLRSIRYILDLRSHSKVSKLTLGLHLE